MKKDTKDISGDKNTLPKISECLQISFEALETLPRAAVRNWIEIRDRQSLLGSDRQSLLDSEVRDFYRQDSSVNIPPANLFLNPETLFSIGSKFKTTDFLNRFLYDEEGHKEHDDDTYDEDGHKEHDDDTLESDYPEFDVLANTSISASAATSTSLALSYTYYLHSNPTASHTIYLDFTGHTTSGTWWKNGNTIQSNAYDRDGDQTTFSNTELLEIQSIWQQVSEDFAPFNVNVTTQEPDIDFLRKTSSSDAHWGVRVLFTDNVNTLDGTPIAAGAGGIAYIGSFNRNIDQPVFVFNKGARAAALTASHEVGHSLYLRHDGISGQTSYHPGHGSGDTSWGSILGAPFSKNLTQWSKGDYYGADNTEDDLTIITTRNGFNYRTDDHGNSQNTASELSFSSTVGLSAYGIIERNTDVDYFAFTTDTGEVSFSITPASKAFVANGLGGYTTEFLESKGANLDIWAGLYNASGTLLAASNPSNLLTASFNLALAAGRYFLRIDGVGQGNPSTKGSTGYTDYGSLGQYSIQGNIAPITIISRLESQGNADLLETNLGYQIQRQGESIQFVRYQGQPVNKDTFADWSAIAVEAVDRGFRLIWEHTNGQYGEWQTDREGNFQNSDSPSTAKLISLESVYQQDLNMDGVIGSSAAIIETQGNVSLLHNSQGYQIQRQDQSTQFVRYQGQSVNKDTFADWSAIAVEAADRGFRLIWEHTNGQYGEWQTDREGNFQNSDSPSTAKLISLESVYQQDLNMDGVIGSSAAIIETQGNVSLLHNSQGYQIQRQDQSTQFVRYQGQPVNKDTFADWSAIAVEAVDRGFRLIWEHTNGQYGEWQTDQEGNFQNSDSPSTAKLIALESVYQQDLNMDGVIGSSAAIIETQGNASLLHNSQHGDITLLGDQENNLLVGDLGDDRIHGLDGNDMLIGGLGHDTLVGGLGADQFFLASTDSSADIITDFVGGVDILGLSVSEFGDVFKVDSLLAEDQFVLGISPTSGGPQFLYDVSSGQLLYDQDGIGQRTAIHIAMLSSKPTLSHTDFVIMP